MYNQIEAILEQYDIEIRQITKGRGTYICDTKEGKKILTPFRGSIERGGRLRECLWKLQSIGFPVEQVVINKEQTSVTVDAVTGERFMLLDYTEGIELNPLKEDDVVAGARLLGEYHSLISKLDFENAVVSEKDKAVEIKIRHYKELIKIRNHIRNKKKKNDFERLFLANAMSLVEVAEKSIEHLQQVRYRSCDYMFCHGDYNQHNIVNTETGWRMIHLENMNYGLAMEDLAYYIRKIMEKNQWNIKLGENLLFAYEQAHALDEVQKEQLYGLLLFPERFWKITNHYMNSNKAWVSGRDIEKLEKVIEQESLRIKFMENLFSFQ